MSIRKFGTEQAQTEVKPEDNDPETLDHLKNVARIDRNRKEPQRDTDDDEPKTAA